MAATSLRVGSEGTKDGWEALIAATGSSLLTPPARQQKDNTQAEGRFQRWERLNW